MSLVIILTVIFLVFCTALLVAPISIRIVRCEDEKSTRIRWFGFRVSVDTPGVRYAVGLPGLPEIVLKRDGERIREKKKKSADGDGKPAPDAAVEKKTKFRTSGPYLPFLKFRKIIIDSVYEIVTLFYRIFLNFSIERGGMTVRIATPDPALTGMLYGWSESMTAAIPSVRRRVDIVPDFCGTGSSVDLDITIRTTVGSHLFDLAVFVKRLPKLALIKFARETKKNRSPDKKNNKQEE